jgi:hypothetical protein
MPRMLPCGGTIAIKEVVRVEAANVACRIRFPGPHNFRVSKGDVMPNQFVKVGHSLIDPLHVIALDLGGTSHIGVFLSSGHTFNLLREEPGTTDLLRAVGAEVVDQAPAVSD